MSGALRKKTAARFLERLGFDAPPQATLDGLKAVYRAWCRGVPFDNARKRLALAKGIEEPLPGGLPEDFATFWLEHGAGGTCWPSSNGLFGLLDACGFAVRRVAASMHDLGTPSHGSLIVAIDGEEFLVDSSMLIEQPLRLRPGQRFETGDPMHPASADPSDGSWLFHFELPMRVEPLPCRLLDDPVDQAFYLERYEASRSESPFNTGLYARRNRADGNVTFVGSTRFHKGRGGTRSETLDAAGLAAALIRDIGYSPTLVERLADANLLG